MNNLKRSLLLTRAFIISIFAGSKSEEESRNTYLLTPQEWNQNSLKATLNPSQRSLGTEGPRWVTPAQETGGHMFFFNPEKQLKKWVPVAVGGGIGAGSSAFAIYCSVPATGNCIGCGSCLIPLVTLVGWAKLKARKKERV